MDKQKGWLKLYRCIEDNWLWDEVPFSYGQAWIDMLMMANHTQTKILFNKKPVVLEVGSFVTSVRKLSVKWGWSKDKVLRFLRTLEKDNMITRNSDNQRTLVTLVNYGIYQDGRDTNEDTDATRTRHKTDTNKDTDAPQTRIKELKNEKELKKGSIAPRPEHIEIIDYLNTKTGSDYKPTTAATQKAINGRLDEGYAVEDFKAVIDVKVSEWANDEKMRQYLCPDTLFRPSNFEKYLQQAKAQRPKSENPHSDIYSMLQQKDAPDWKQKHAEETEANINNLSSDDYPFN